MADHNRFWIPGDVPSSKNSRVFNVQMKRSFKSKICQKWERSTAPHFRRQKKQFQNAISELEFPIHVIFHFIRKTRRKFDYINMAQIVQDAMVEHGWIADDNCDYMLPSFHPHDLDKDNPGVWIII